MSNRFLKLVAEQLVVPPTSGLDRGSMPQIKDLDGFEKFIQSKGVETKTVEIPALHLVGSQNNLDMDKVQSIADTRKYGKLLVTSDMQVIDGHHRWAAAFNNGDNLSALIVDLPVPELLDFASEFSGTKYMESILEMSYPKGFSLDTLKNTKSIKGKMEYAQSFLGKSIGKGSSRIVFTIDNNKVLKLAWNRKGFAQNETEIMSYRTHDITAEIFDFADDYLWVEMERVTPFKTDSQMKSATGLDHKELYEVLAYVNDVRTNYKWGRTLPKKFNDWDEVWEDDFTSGLIRFLGDYGLTQYCAEFSQLKHFGVNSKGEVKLIDYGINEEVLDKFY